MSTRYRQLSELYDLAHEQATKQRDACITLASAIIRQLLSSLDVPADLRPGATSEKPLPAVQCCMIPADDSEPVKVDPVAVTGAVTTDDGETYKMGLIVRVYSMSAGIPPHPVLFRMTFRHKLNDTFDVTSWPGAEPATLSPHGQDQQPLRDFVERFSDALTNYFAARIRGERKRPIGFELIP